KPSHKKTEVVYTTVCIKNDSTHVQEFCQGLTFVDSGGLWATSQAFGKNAAVARIRAGASLAFTDSGSRLGAAIVEQRDVDAASRDQQGAHVEPDRGNFVPDHPAKERRPDQAAVVERRNDGGGSHAKGLRDQAKPQSAEQCNAGKAQQVFSMHGLPYRDAQRAGKYGLTQCKIKHHGQHAL